MSTEPIINYHFTNVAEKYEVFEDQIWDAIDLSLNNIEVELRKITSEHGAIYVDGLTLFFEQLTKNKANGEFIADEMDLFSVRQRAGQLTEVDFRVCELISRKEVLSENPEFLFNIIDFARNSTSFYSLTEISISLILNNLSYILINRNFISQRANTEDFLESLYRNLDKNRNEYIIYNLCCELILALRINGLYTGACELPII